MAHAILVLSSREGRGKKKKRDSTLTLITTITDWPLDIILDRNFKSFVLLHFIMKSSATIPNSQQGKYFSDSNSFQPMTETSPSICNGNDHQEYEKQAEEMLENIWKLYDDNESWTDETKSQDGLDIVTSKNFPRWGKVFRLIVRSVDEGWGDFFSSFIRARSLEHMQTS